MPFQNVHAFLSQIASFVNYVQNKGSVNYLKRTMSAFPFLKSLSLSHPGYLVQLQIYLTSSAFNECQRSNESVEQPVPNQSHFPFQNVEEPWSWSNLKGFRGYLLYKLYL